MPKSVFQETDPALAQVDEFLAGSDDILAKIDALKFSSTNAELPPKRNLFRRLRDLFVSQPERWRRKRIGWLSWRDDYGTWHGTDRDGWVMDMPDRIGERALGFYRTGFFWIRVGEVELKADGLHRVDTNVWVYIFCPRFRRMLSKYRNWRLLKDLEKRDG
jgi:hypothetical protein